MSAVVSNPNNRDVFNLAWPIAMNAIFLQAILIIDTILVGGLGEGALASMGIATSVASIIVGVLFALANGTQILIAQAFGAGSDRALKSGFWSGLFVALGVALVGCLFIIFGRDTVIGRLTEVPAIAVQASTYLLIFMAVIVGVAICQNISVFFYATGRPKLPFYSKLIELPFNALLSYALIYGAAGFPELGLAGAAIGSAAAVLIRTIYLVCCLYVQKFDGLFLSGWAKSTFTGTVIQHLRNALPIAGTFISMNLAFNVCMMAYTQLGIHEFAALTILLIWVRTSSQLVTAWCQATGILVGHLLGQERRDHLDQFIGKAWRVALGLGVLIAFIYAVTPLLFELVYPNLQQQTLAVVWSLLPMLIILPLLKSSNTVCGNVLRAGGQAGYAFKVHVSAQWLFLVPATLLFVLVFELSVVAVFSLLLFEEILKALPFHRRMRGGSWKRKLVSA